MPDRLIRDDILDSARYLGLSSDTARMLFVHLILVADDLGNCEAEPIFVRRRLLASALEDPSIVKLLSELADADLIRLYENGGKRYAHIPRFRQRLRYVNGKCPRPPESIECTEINRLASQKTVLSQSTAGPRSDSSQQKRREVEEKRSEEKNYSLPSVRVIPPPAEDVPYQQIVNLYHELLPELPRIAKLTSNRKAQIRARWKGKDAEDLEDWKQFFALVKASRFLKGLSPAPAGRKVFLADLDWLTKEGNFMKVVEGKYA